MSDRPRKAREAALTRRTAVPPPEMVAHFRSQSDLYTVCPVCGKRRYGTFAEVTAPCDGDHPA